MIVEMGPTSLRTVNLIALLPWKLWSHRNFVMARLIVSLNLTLPMMNLLQDVAKLLMKGAGQVVQKVTFYQTIQCVPRLFLDWQREVRQWIWRCEKCLSTKTFESMYSKWVWKVFFDQPTFWIRPVWKPFQTRVRLRRFWEYRGWLW